jgi:two-component sensor histidine kinase
VMLKEINSNLLLSVYDDGIGLPGNFEQGAKKSFGHKMINAFLQKLNGKMKMYSEDGTKVDIEIINYKKI